MHRPGHAASLWWQFNRFLERHLPAGLYQRSLIILVAPMVLLQSIMAGIILERHWDNVTKVLARSLAREIGARQRTLRPVRQDAGGTRRDRGRSPTSGSGSTSPSCRTQACRARFRRPCSRWSIHKLTRYLDQGYRQAVLDRQRRAVRLCRYPRRGREGTDLPHADGRRPRLCGITDALLMWMVVSSLVLLAIAVTFLRNQITPILDLRSAARSFGLGRDVGDFQPRGAARGARCRHKLSST